MSLLLQMNRSGDLLNGSAYTKVMSSDVGRLPNPIASQNSNSSLESGSDDEPHTKHSSSSEKDADLPKRPLSAYNLFFQLERENILKGEEDQNYTYKNVAKIALIHYKECRLGKPKRKHRKSHGVIGFRELARLIAQKWKKLDNTVKELFEERAQIEKALYQKEIDALQSMQKYQMELPSPQIESVPMSRQQITDSENSERRISAKPTLCPNIPQQTPDNIYGFLHSNSKISTRPITKHLHCESDDGQGTDAPKAPILFQPVEVGFEVQPLSDGIMLETSTDTRTVMRMRPQPDHWQISHSSQPHCTRTLEMMQCTEYNSTGWTNGPRKQGPKQPRRNSTSFYPIDGDEQVDLIQLNDSFRENRGITSDDSMSEEESEISAMLATFEKKR